MKVPVGNNPEETEHTVYLITKKQREKPLRPLNPFQGMPQRPKKTPTRGLWRPPPPKGSTAPSSTTLVTRSLKQEPGGPEPQQGLSLHGRSQGKKLHGDLFQRDPRKNKHPLHPWEHGLSASFAPATYPETPRHSTPPSYS